MMKGEDTRQKEGHKGLLFQKPTLEGSVNTAEHAQEFKTAQAYTPLSFFNPLDGLWGMW